MDKIVLDSGKSMFTVLLELRERLKEAESILNIITPNSNPAYLTGLVKKYKKKKEKR